MHANSEQIFFPDTVKFFRMASINCIHCMPRKKVPLSPDHYYSITARCINKEWFSIPLSEVWKIMEDYLYFVSFGFNFKIKSFVLMSNHFHLILQAPDGNLSEGMRYFMRETSRQIGRESGRINQVYGSRFYRSMITSYHYYMHAYKYVYRNPVEAGICSSVVDYPYSTLNRILGRGILHIPLVQDEILFGSDLNLTLDWLETAPKPEEYESVRKALKKGIFSLPRDPITKKKNTLEYTRY